VTSLPFLILINLSFLSPTYRQNYGTRPAFTFPHKARVGLQ
jgi:hypothetical protein